MSTEENKKVVRGYVEEGFKDAAAGNPNALERYFAPTYTNHTSRHHDRSAQGVAGLKAYAGEVKRATSEFTVTAGMLIAEGDMVAVQWNMHGTHQGKHKHAEAGEVQGTGKEMNVSGLSLFRLAAGKIIEGWNHDNVTEVLLAIGAIPAKTSASA